MDITHLIAGGRPASAEGVSQTGAKKLDARVMKEIEMRFAASLLEAALPKSGSSFGKGLAGNVARGHLAEQLASALVKSDSLKLFANAGPASAPASLAAAGSPSKSPPVIGSSSSNG